MVLTVHATLGILAPPPWPSGGMMGTVAAGSVVGALPRAAFLPRSCGPTPTSSGLGFVRDAGTAARAGVELSLGFVRLRYARGSGSARPRGRVGLRCGPALVRGRGHRDNRPREAQPRVRSAPLRHGLGSACPTGRVGLRRGLALVRDAGTAVRTDVELSPGFVRLRYATGSAALAPTGRVGLRRGLALVRGRGHRGKSGR
jgi:hypothetical protein